MYRYINTSALDHFIQKWYDEICNQSKLKYFKLILNIFYISIILDKRPLKYLTSFRLSSHRLEIEVTIYYELNSNAKYAAKILVNKNTNFYLISKQYIKLHQKYQIRSAQPKINKLFPLFPAEIKECLENCQNLCTIVNDEEKKRFPSCFVSGVCLIYK